MNRLLALLTLLLALPASAQPTEITGTDTVRFWWPSASGPIIAYESKLVYLDGTESTSVFGLPPQAFRPRRGMVFHLHVRGCRSGVDGPICDGQWAEPADGVRVCPIAADVDCNLAVGVSDFGVLAKDWGKRVEEEPE